METSTIESPVALTKPLYTPDEVCETLGLGRSTFWRLVGDRSIRIIRVSERKPRVTRAELERLLSEGIQPKAETEEATGASAPA